MSVGLRAVGRRDTLEIVFGNSRRVAQRYPASPASERASDVVDSTTDTPVEVLALPLPRHRAAGWLWLHFDDVGGANLHAVLAILTCSD
jgi:hypothetical protein